MFCKNCGIELEDAMAFCPECGVQVETEPVCEEVETVVETIQEEACEESVVEEKTAVEAEPAAENTEEFCSEAAETIAEQPAEEYGFAPQEFSEETLPPAKKSNKLFVSIIAAVVMIALVVAGIFVVPKFFGGNYEDVAMNYGLAYAEADLIEASKYSITSYVEAYDKMVDYSCKEYEMTREEFFELLSEQYGEKVANVEQLFAIMMEEAVTYLQEEYGNYTISAKVAETEEMSADSIAELKEYIKEDQGYDYPSMFEGVDAEKISEAYIVDVELTINGTESSDTETQEVTVVKYNGKWKAIGD